MISFVIIYDIFCIEGGSARTTETHSGEGALTQPLCKLALFFNCIADFAPVVRCIVSIGLLSPPTKNV